MNGVELIFFSFIIERILVNNQNLTFVDTDTPRWWRLFITIYSTNIFTNFAD